MDLKGRDFLKLLDFTSEEILSLINLAADFKDKKKKGIPHRLCEGKNIALIFEKTSTRTRCSFEIAARDLGMGVTYLDPTGSQIGKKESIADTARVLSSIYDAIEYRGYGQTIVEELAKYSSVPVLNGLTDEFHPTQILADMLTIRERFGYLKGINFVYMGDARFNMGNSLMVGCAKMGVNFTACCPEKYFPDKKLIAECEKIAKETGSALRFETNPKLAVKNADVLVPPSRVDDLDDKRMILYRYRVSDLFLLVADNRATPVRGWKERNVGGVSINRNVVEILANFMLPLIKSIRGQFVEIPVQCHHHTSKQKNAKQKQRERDDQPCLRCLSHCASSFLVRRFFIPRMSIPVK